MIDKVPVQFNDEEDEKPPSLGQSRSSDLLNLERGGHINGFVRVPWLGRWLIFCGRQRHKNVYPILYPNGRLILY
jgi:hypothetical protein